jgi:hypothetical protein
MSWRLGGAAETVSFLHHLDKNQMDNGERQTRRSTIRPRMIMLRHRDLQWRDVLKIASTTAFCAAALFALQLAASSAYAAPAACKGVEETTCGTTEGCSWVKATKLRKGYCRAKPAPKATKAKPAPKAAPAGAAQ